MRRIAFFPILVLSMLAAPFTVSCSSDNQSSSSAQVLDPTQAHYGNADDAWGTLWWKWVYDMPQTAGKCFIPFQDPTGASCRTGQSGDVFFLAGTSAGTVVRDQCTIPSGKAIFFPILTFDADNGGVPQNMLMSDAALMGVVQMQMDAVPVSGLSAEFDGAPIMDLARFRTDLTMFDYTLSPEPNTYTCEGAMGVTGTISPSYQAGYYIMLPPPSLGSHTLHFAGSSPKSMPPLNVDVTYHFTVTAT